VCEEPPCSEHSGRLLSARSTQVLGSLTEQGRHGSALVSGPSPELSPKLPSVQEWCSEVKADEESGRAGRRPGRIFFFTHLAASILAAGSEPMSCPGAPEAALRDAMSLPTLPCAC